MGPASSPTALTTWPRTGAEDLADGATGLQQGMHGTDEQPGLLDGAEQLAAGVEGDGTSGKPRPRRRS